jgi:hypothetical protein
VDDRSIRPVRLRIEFACKDESRNRALHRPDVFSICTEVVHPVADGGIAKDSASKTLDGYERRIFSSSSRVFSGASSKHCTAEARPRLTCKIWPACIPGPTHQAIQDGFVSRPMSDFLKREADRPAEQRT